jgi:hypothetical protein
VTATILSLVALSAPVITDWIISKKPEIEGVVLEGEGGTVKFAVFNTGDAPTSIKGINVSYWLKNEDGEKVMHTTKMLAGDRIDRVIEPGKVHHMIAKTQDKSGLPMQVYPGIESSIGNPLDEECILEVIHHDFENTEINTKIEYKCLPGSV